MTAARVAHATLAAGQLGPLPALPRPQPWAQALIARAAGPVPRYGSPEWHALPADSPARVAACVAAAEVWRYEQATMPDRLALELAVAAEPDEDLVADRARAAMARAAELDRTTRQVIDASCARLHRAARPVPAFAEARPVVDTDDWPAVARPGDADPAGGTSWSWAAEAQFDYGEPMATCVGCLTLYPVGSHNADRVEVELVADPHLEQVAGEVQRDWWCRDCYADRAASI